MKKLLKWIVIALGACVVLAAGVIANTANNGKDSTATATPSSWVQATAVPTKAVALVAEVKPADVSKNTATPRPTTLPPTAIPPTIAPPTDVPVKETCKIGDACTSGGVSLTVVKVQKATKLDLWTADSGNIYVDIEVIIENQTPNTEPYDPYYFGLKDADGFEYDYSGDYLAKPSLKSGELAQGEKARGHVVFEVLAGAKGLVVSYEPHVLLGNYTPIKIALD